jgi:hypothetical protein
MRTKGSIIVFLVLLILSSCVTQKRCYLKFPPTVDTIKITIIRDSIIYRDTTIFIKLPGELRVDSIKIPCPEVPGYIPKKVFAETSLAKASAWWQFPNIRLELIQKDTTIERRLDNAIKEAWHWQEEYMKVTEKPQAIKYIPDIYRIALWLWAGVILALGGYISFRIFKK